MNQIQTKGIILTRTDYGEADRIVTLLTPDQGKLRLMVRGVRKMKSRLAGGIELFSISDITFIRGRGEIGTLISARLQTHYGNIVKDIERVQLGYELIKLLNKITEDETEPEYFTLLQQSFAALNDAAIDLVLVRCWFEAQLLKLGGNSPNLRTERDGMPLQADKTYNFAADDMSFAAHENGRFTADHIKYLRLLFANGQPAALAKVQQGAVLLEAISPIMTAMRYEHIASV